MKITLITLLFAALLFACHTGYICANDAKSAIKNNMTIEEITSILGPHYADIGSGIHILQYDFSDSSHLLIGGPNMKLQPMYIRVISPRDK